MLDLVLAAMLMQVQDLCHAVMPRVRPARCPAWRALSNDSGAETFVDPASLRRDAAGFEVATRLVHAAPQRDGGHSRVTVNHFDCAARTVATRRTRIYDTRGILLAQSEATGAEAAPQPAPAGSAFADLLGRFCPAAPPAAGADPCLAAFPAATGRSCPRWRSVQRTNEREVFVNPASLARRGDNFEISLRLVYATDHEYRVRSMVSRHLYDCARRTTALLHIIVYDAAGRVIEDHGPRPHEAGPSAWPAGSPSARVLHDYCRR